MTYTVVAAKTHEVGSEGLTPRVNWRDFHEALQRVQSQATAEADIPELLCYDNGWALFVVDSEWGRRALAEAIVACARDHVGLAIAGDASFNDINKWEALQLRAQYLKRAGVNPKGYGLTRPQRWGAWTVFPLR